jgi:hypothetical protein
VTPAAKVTWRQALAWRLNRQLLDPVGSLRIQPLGGERLVRSRPDRLRLAPTMAQPP